MEDDLRKFDIFSMAQVVAGNIADWRGKNIFLDYLRKREKEKGVLSRRSPFSTARDIQSRREVQKRSETQILFVLVFLVAVFLGSFAGIIKYGVGGKLSLDGVTCFFLGCMLVSACVGGLLCLVAFSSRLYLLDTVHFHLDSEAREFFRDFAKLFPCCHGLSAALSHDNYIDRVTAVVEGRLCTLSGTFVIYHKVLREIEGEPVRHNDPERRLEVAKRNEEKAFKDLANYHGLAKKFGLGGHLEILIKKAEERMNAPEENVHARIIDKK